MKEPKITRKRLSKDILDFQLLPRLKVMGFLLVFLGCFTCSYSYLSTLIPSDFDEGFENPTEVFQASGFDIEQEETPPFHLNRKEKIQFYGIGALFTLIGTSCLIIVKRKKSRLLG